MNNFLSWCMHLFVPFLFSCRDIATSPFISYKIFWGKGPSGALTYFIIHERVVAMCHNSEITVPVASIFAG